MASMRSSETFWTDYTQAGTQPNTYGKHESFWNISTDFIHINTTPSIKAIPVISFNHVLDGNVLTSSSICQLMYADLFRPISLCSFSTCQLVYAYLQGVVTYMSCVEAFATGIKIESSDQSPFGGWSRNQGDLQTAKNQQWRTHGYNLTFDPWSNQEPQKGMIKQSSTLFADQKTWSQSQTPLRFWLRLCMSYGSWAGRSRQTRSLLCSAILNWS